MNFLRITFSVLFLSLALHAVGQDDDKPRKPGSKIIDDTDTTESVYGPKTSLWFYEEDVLVNKPVMHRVDTAIRNFHQFTYVQRHGNLYQDLGNIGTAIRPIYYQTPDVIGVSSGFQSFDLYWTDERIRYFNTKSPYSNMRVTLGGKGRSMTRVTYSRNINPHWNFGFNFRSLLIDKQINRTGKGDRNVRSYYYDLYTTYFSKDSSYRVFVNFQRNHHQAFEMGGVSAETFTSYKQFFAPRTEYNLTAAKSNELRINEHIFQEYRVGKALQVYHILDRYRQEQRFLDKPPSEPSGYFDYNELHSSDVSDRAKFKYFRNEVGIKGNLLKLFYNGYYAVRRYSMTYNNIDEDTLRLRTVGLEHYLGGRMSLRLDSIGEISGRAEILPQSSAYRLEGQIKSRWFEASLKQMQYAPSFLQQAYRGSYDVWYPTAPNNYRTNFGHITVSELKGAVHYNSKVLSLSPGVTFTRIGNYVYFKQDLNRSPQTILPYQDSKDEDEVFVLPEVSLQLVMARHIFLRGNAIYANPIRGKNNGLGKGIQLPKIFVNGQLSYENIFFHGNMDMQSGVDVHYQSTYNALGYDVPVQQFYVVDHSKDGPTATGYNGNYKAFPVIDIFFNTRIKRARIFVKYNNVLQAFTGQGYMPTPYYPGQRSVLDFGFDWNFYD